MTALTRKQLEADLAFLADRACQTGSVSFGGKREAGMLSNAIVAWAYGIGDQNRMPMDRGDYGACVRTVRKMPRHRQAAAREALRRARAALPDQHKRGGRWVTI